MASRLPRESPPQPVAALADSLPPPPKRRWFSLRIPSWGRSVVLTCCLAGSTTTGVFMARSWGLAEREAVLLSLLAGGAVGYVLAMFLVLVPEWRAEADRRWLIECLADVSRIDREKRFAALLAHGERHELHGLAKAIHAALLTAHKDRLEAASLRRELDSRVQRRTRAVVAELSRLSNTDGLTGLLNRRGFDGAFSGLYDLAAATSDELAVLAIDLDYFKQLNDACGHDKGDEALKAAGEVMNTQLRDGDIAGRVGGDEFIIALRGTGAVQALGVAKRLIELYAKNPGAVGLPVRWPTFSIGIACAGEHRSENADSLKRMADLALYAAKRAGRGDALVYQPAMSAQTPAAAEPAKKPASKAA